MSAGGLSYSGLRSKAKVTLPSVDMWGTDLNILKDPPKSIHTRRIDKVGQTSSILLAQDESGDRISEMINVYQRGVNPMVSVSYGNEGNNGGRSSVFNNQRNAYLPYRLQNLRPPVQRQEDLLPLSRLPRNWFYQYSNPSMPDIVQAAQCNEQGSCINDKILYASAATNKKAQTTITDDSFRTAPTNTISTDMLQMSSKTNLSAPNQQTYMDANYDTGAERKSIQLDKRDVVAVTNFSGGERSATSEFETMDGKRVGERRDPIPVQAAMNSNQMYNEKEYDQLAPGRTGDVMHLPVATHKYTDGQLEYRDADFNAKDPKQIQMNRRIYEAFSQKGIDVAGNGVEKMDTNKFINKEKYLCIAKTAKTTRENFVHPYNETQSTVPTKPFLYKDVKTQPTSIYDISSKNNPDKTKGVAEKVLHAYSQANKSAQVRKMYVPDTLGKGFVEEPIRVSVRSSQRMEGGDRATDHSVNTFRVKPHLYTTAQTTKIHEGGDVHMADAVLNRELTSKTHGSAMANKTFLPSEQIRENDVFLSHRMQNITPISTSAVKTLNGANEHPLHDATLSLHNDKRTPLHSAMTNTQSPYSMTTMPDMIREQKRRVLLTETSTTATDAGQIANVGDVYSIQARGSGSKNTHTMLSKGGFEAQGSAVPVFDRYENYNYSIRDEERQGLRQKATDMFHERHPMPVF